MYTTKATNGSGFTVPICILKNKNDNKYTYTSNI